jgi:hypothetical protein
MTVYQSNLVTSVLIVRIPTEGIEDFRAYKDAVLPLLPEFNGRLERRLRNQDGTIEIHIVNFASDADRQNFGMILGVRRKPGCWKNHLRSWNCFLCGTSPNGTKRTSRQSQPMSAFGGKADIDRNRFAVGLHPIVATR